MDGGPVVLSVFIVEFTGSSGLNPFEFRLISKELVGPKPDIRIIDDGISCHPLKECASQIAPTL